MKLRLLIQATVLFLLFTKAAESQLESSNWHFGPTSKGLYFSSTGTVTVTNISYTPYGAEGCSVLSYPVTGNLEFYTDGSKVVDAGHSVMPNGSGLLSLSSSEGSGKIAADPANCNRYYIFHNTSAFEDGSATHKLYYSVVDMTLPGNGTVVIPKGDVVTGLKNILVASNVAEGIELIPVTNSHNFWIIVPSSLSSSVSVYKFTASGISFINSYPLISTMSDIRPIRFCNANNKIAIGSMNDYDKTLLLDFDRTTGSVTGQSIIPGLPAGTHGNYYGIYSLEWSQNGTKLYISKYRQGSSGGKLYQYDLTASLTQLVYDVNPFSISFSARGLKMGPDGKIYFLYMNTAGAVIDIGAVNNPNNPAATCAFNPTQINMGTDLLNTNKFPDFLYSNNSLMISNDAAISFTKPCGSTSDLSFININRPLTDNDGYAITYQVLSNTFSGATATYTDSSVVQYINSTPPPYVDTLTIRYCVNHCISECSNFNIVLYINSGSNADLSLIPNVFTPNEDLKNDHFKIGSALNACTKFRTITIYNRWGQKVFESEDPDFEWDGKVSGNNVPDGVYFAIIETGESENIRKDAISISIVR